MHNRDLIISKLRQSGASITPDSSALPQPPAVGDLDRDSLYRLLAERCLESGTTLHRLGAVHELLTLLIEVTKDADSALYVSQHQVCRDLGIAKAFRDSGLSVADDSVWQTTGSGLQLAECKVAITGCDWIVANPGSALISSECGGDRLSGVIVNHHIVVFTPNQVVPSLAELFSKLGSQPIPQWLCLATGSSRTADIEKTLVKPAHGTADLTFFWFEGQVEQ